MDCMVPPQPDPFRGYLGARARRGEREFVVVGHAVQDRNVLFRLRDAADGHEEHVTLLELLDLLQA